MVKSSNLKTVNIAKFIPFFLIGAMLIFLTSMLYIGSEEQVHDAIENHLLKFIVSKFLLSFAVSLFWSVIAYSLYRSVCTNDRYKIAASCFFIYSIAGYFVLSIFFVLIFIYLPR